MNDSLKENQETFTVEQGFYIAMSFVSNLLILVQEPVVYIGEDDMPQYSFIRVSHRNRNCTEWNEAVRRVTGILKEKQRTLYLTLGQIFQCILEYCKIQNKQCNNGLAYTVNTLESMEKNPNNYWAEWKVWEEAIQYVKDFRMNAHDFYWEGQPAINDSLKESPETFTVEQGYYIGMPFFSRLWPLVEPHLGEKEKDGMCEIFFTDISCFGEYCAEWNEAVRRVTGLPKEEQRTLYLTLHQIFRCALECCKLHNKQYNNDLAYTVNLLESMEKDPQNYPAEWKAWEEAIQYVKDFRMNDHNFDWEEEPAWPYG